MAYKVNNKVDKDLFNRLLGKALREARKGEKLTQAVMSDIIGYSSTQISKYEGEGDRNRVAIPAYVLFQYARLCQKTMEELCQEYIDEKAEKDTGFYSKRDQRGREKLKTLTDKEKEVIYRLRTDSTLGDIDLLDKVDIMLSAGKQDIRAMYCLNKLSESNPKIAWLLRGLVFRAYREFVHDSEENKNAILKDITINGFAEDTKNNMF